MNFSNKPLMYKNIEKVILQPGNFYQFKYVNFENDPFPLVYYLNCRNAICDETGKWHRYIQAINFHYIPRVYRLQFVENWLRFIEKHKMILLSKFLTIWTELNRRYPYLSVAYRRYLTNPIGLIKNVQHIKTSLVIPMIKGSIESDFSLYDKLIFAQKYREFNKVVTRNNVKRKLK